MTRVGLGRSRTFTSALVALAVFLGAPGAAHALEPFASLVPNPYTTMNSEGRIRPCINCHNNPDGGGGCATPPCLNPFGMAFRANGFMWTPGLAALDSDGDGFTNGQELQDPMGLWVSGPYPGVPGYSTAPGFSTITPGDTDVDHDRYCRFGRDLNSDGDCLDAGENEGSFDCNDMVSSIHSGATEMCSTAADDDCNGFPTLTDPVCSMVVDLDGDGRCVMGRDMNGDRNCGAAAESSTMVEDCDDTRANVYRGATENCADTIDNDCDGDTDLADGACQGDTDEDGDGYCPIGVDSNGDGDCTDASEMVLTIGDCDDMNVAVGPGATELCGDGLDNECDGTADLNDVECRPYIDDDHDGYCPMGTDVDHDGDCTGPTDLMAGVDCDDGNSLRSPGLVELCTDNPPEDEDCDGVSNLADVGADGRTDSTCLGYVDRDNDGYCYIGPDSNDDGDCLDPGEFGMASDCDETSGVAASVNPTATEVCTDAVDNDCDGSADAADNQCIAYVDLDHDGFCPTGSDGNGDGDCADSGEQGGPVDEAEGSPTIYPGAPENCIDRLDNDQDGAVDDADDQCVGTVDADDDGYCPVGRDLNGDGDCTDPGETIIVSDCDDSDAAIGPTAMETCTNFRDDDCDVDVDLFDADCFVVLDRDGDGYCGMGIDDNTDGDCLDESEDRFGADCDDEDPTRGPGRPEVCENGFDDDCDTNVDLDDTDCTCRMDAECDDSDPCTVDSCRPAGAGCRHVRATMCIDGGPMPDAGPPPPPPPMGGGCSARSGDGGSWAVLGLFLSVLAARRRRAWLRARG